MRVIIEGAVTRLAPAADKKNITISYAKSSKLKVFGNTVGLTEIVAILLDNAIKYSPDKSKIQVSVEDTASSVAIHVKDQGVGIPPDQINQIFDRFYRADPSRTKQAAEGYGLGLAIAAELAKTNGASLSVQSIVAKGSTFTLAVPKQG